MRPACPPSNILTAILQNILADILSTGVDCIDPLDPLGGMQISELKEKFGTSVCC